MTEKLSENRKSNLKALAASGNLLAFTLATFPLYEVNWHHKTISRALNRFLKREVKRLMIFCPPRHGKSELVSRRLPALIHGMYPNDEIMAATYNSELAGDMTTDIQRIMDRKEYHELFPRSRITPEGTVTKYARNTTEHELLPDIRPSGEVTYLRGKYRAQGIGGSFSGRGAHWILIDDPIKNRDDADSKTVREGVWKFYSSTMRTRLEGDGSILLTMTRWHEDDLAGRLLRLAKTDPSADQWEVVRLTAIREHDDLNPDDPRLPGEALWPSKFDETWLSAAKAASSRDWASLYQQRPKTEDGNIFKESWFKFYKSLPERFDQMIQSWDFASKDKTGSDYCVGQVWGRLGSNKYLVYQFRGRPSFPESCRKLVEISIKYPNAHKRLIEAKANGPAIIQTLKNQVSGLIEVEPRGDKVARANAVAPEIESGCVWLPHPDIAPWIADFISEVCEFPNSAHDDQVDALTQALDELRKAAVLHIPLAGHGTGFIF